MADRLGLPFVERAIPVAVARKINVPLQEALADDLEHRSRVGRVLDTLLISSGLFVGVPPAAEELGATPDIEKTETVMRRLADTTGAVILGRAGVFVLKGHPEVLHVRLDGNVESRRRAAAERYGIDYAAASREQEETDRARLAYIQHYYPRAGSWNDPKHYHVVLDSTALSHEACVEMIAQAADDLFRGSGSSRGRS